MKFSLRQIWAGDSHILSGNILEGFWPLHFYASDRTLQNFKVFHLHFDVGAANFDDFIDEKNQSRDRQVPVKTRVLQKPFSMLKVGEGKYFYTVNNCGLTLILYTDEN